MANLAANLSWLFTERPLIERFAAAAAAGFSAVEILFPYELSPADLASALSSNGLELVLMNLPAGDPGKGERGFAARPGDEFRFADALELALDYARVCGCRRLHAMAGQRIDGVDLATHEDVLVRSLVKAAPRCSDAGISLLIEPLNEIDNPGYVLTSSSQAIAILDRVAHSNVALQLDLYHTFVTEGCVEERIRALRGRFEHVQIAGVPGRHEPSTGELDGHGLLSLLDAEDYAGWVGLEYAPVTTTEAGLTWAAPYLSTAVKSWA